MTPRAIHSVLRSLADAGPPASDAELLRRYEASDTEAFAELVRRHGRLVWTVCRHQTRSDAEADDAFQATFLVLLRNARKVRDPGKLSSWLHGVAFKVCGKARQSAKRRTAREHANAVQEGNGSAVPESAWDRALAAVHEEVAGLPDSLRVPFVLCCLEGKGTTEAADQLGWKLGTVASRLSRAKDVVLAKLNARGLTLGVVAGVGLTAPPAATAARAMTLTQAGATIPASILHLSHGVIGMSVKPVKLLAAAVILAIGFGGSVGPGWLATADAQQPGKAAVVQPDPNEELRRLRADLDRAQAVINGLQAKADAAQLTNQLALSYLNTANVQADPRRFKTAKHEYQLVPVGSVSGAQFRDLLQSTEAQGWEFAGTAPLDDPKQVVAAFRRPLAGTATANPFNAYRVIPDGPHAVNPPAAAGTPIPDKVAGPQEYPNYTPTRTPRPTDLAFPVQPGSAPSLAPSPAVNEYRQTPGATPVPEVKPTMVPMPTETARPSEPSNPFSRSPAADPKAAPRPRESRPAADPVAGATAKTVPDSSSGSAADPLSAPTRMATTVEDPKALRDEIRRLNDRLAAMEKLSKPTPEVVFDKSSTLFEPVTLAHILTDLGQKEFPSSGRITVRVADGKVVVTGDKAVTDWAKAVVKAMSFQGPTNPGGVVYPAVPTR